MYIMAVLTQHWGLDVALVFLSAFVAAYLYMTRNFNYWSKKGVVEIPPIPFFGNFLDCCLFRLSTSVLLGSLYKRGKDLPYLGFYVFDKPALILRDPDIIKRVLVRDFSYFANRYVSTHESDTIASGNMFLLRIPEWRNVRNKISPIFTSGKMKNMFQLMDVIGENLVTHLENLKLHGDGRVIEVKDICAKYTTDVITSCAFGLQVDSLNDPESLFRKYGTMIFGFPTYLRSVEFATFFFAPILVKLLRLNFFSKGGSDFMRNVFNQTMDHRMESNTHRNDLIDLLLEVKRSQDENDDPAAFKLEGDRLVSQAATFFAAGFETSSTTIAFALYELALQPNIQSRLREEIISALAENGGKINYEMVMKLSYLDMVVSEALRKHPSLPFLDRQTISDYEIPEHNLVIEKGTGVYIPLFGIHYDPEYFPEPQKFDPERFSNENKQKIPACVYLPFGEGPRSCVGLRFGLLVSKLGLVNFILNYEVTACAQTLIPMRYETKALLLKPDGGLCLNVRRIDSVVGTSN